MLISKTETQSWVDRDVGRDLGGLSEYAQSIFFNFSITGNALKR